MNRTTRPGRALLGWLIEAHWRDGRAAMLAGALSIAIGVALALGVHLVNRSALTEFASALAIVNGDAQAQIIGRTGEFDDQVFVPVATAPGVAAASPVLELKALAWRESDATPAGSVQTGMALKVIGIDPMRAARVTPALLPALAESAQGDPSALFSDDAIFLSRAAARELGTRPGDRLMLVAGEHRRSMRVQGSVEGVGDGQSVAIIDIGNAQEQFGRVGRLTRIDLRFHEGADSAAVRATIASRLPASALWSSPQAAGQRMSNLSRAYRINLNVLALVALFTGAFIVQATLALRVARQQQEIALLGVLGAPRRFAATRVLIDAVVIGSVGALVGVGAGVALAWVLLSLTGGDLGGGYFDRSAIGFALDPVAIATAFVGGLAIALAGAQSPMRAARQIAPARALRTGATEVILGSRRRRLWALGLAALALPLLAAPPILDLPLAAYAAIALLLVAGVMLTGSLIGPSARVLVTALERWRPGATLWLATCRVAGAPGSAGAALGGVVASFALASAMTIMVSSFRVSVSDWLDQVLPADLYARLQPASAAGGFGESLQAAIATLPGVRQVEFSRVVPLLIDERRPPVALVARPLREAGAENRLPLVGKPASVAADELPVWVSEPFAEITGVRSGQTVLLPISESTSPIRAVVAGIWRDYARQHGAIAIDLSDYRRLTGDHAANEVAWWLTDPGRNDELIERARAMSPLIDTMEYRDTGQLKSLSLRIFDRSFAITRALEAIAIAVALFGVATAVASEALARSREFGMLRHLGLTRRQVGWQFMTEAMLGTLIASLWGLALGAMVAWILVHRVNPHSFHWTMSMHWPVGVLAASAFAMITLAALAARLAAREATGAGPVLAVRQDW